MDASKILMTVCAVVLSITLILSILALSSLRNAVDESDSMRQEAAVLVDKLVDRLEEIETDAKEEMPTLKEDPSTTFVDGEYWIRAVNDKVGIFTDDGALLHVLDVMLDSMSPSARAELEKGVSVGSVRELIDRLIDYTT